MTDTLIWQNLIDWLQHSGMKTDSESLLVRLCHFQGISDPPLAAFCNCNAYFRYWKRTCCNKNCHGKLPALENPHMNILYSLLQNYSIYQGIAYSTVILSLNGLRPHQPIISALYKYYPSILPYIGAEKQKLKTNHSLRLILQPYQTISSSIPFPG